MAKAVSTSSAYGRAGVAAFTASKALPAPDPRLFSTPQAREIKREICAVGRKLWLRQFVDGNGGNISCRIGPNEVICTPTMLSKFDLRPRDLCMVDLEGRQIAGTKPATSEILLHLEIYKKVPQAKAAVHCHPPHATGYAVAGLVPPNMMIPEFEIFVGKVAIAPYETPGTQAFAETVLPFVEHHNTILLRNHGVVSWAETVTLAEWNCEVLETYCNIVGAARQLGVPLSIISDEKGRDLLARKKRMGLPDIRFASPAARRSEARQAEKNRAAAPAGAFDAAQVEAIVRRVTRQVLAELQGSQAGAPANRPRTARRRPATD
ncbi:MAG TPA: class II aldolase/adducin family protein [Terracidiphilus sp.]|jgi:L-fuculose-phosphate aldolase|nr:class II aldolase/adducin family protein [Terracidiphilus sp.]